MQRVCFGKTVSLFNHALQPSQALALFYQLLLFMIDHGNVTTDDEVLHEYLSDSNCDVEQRTDAIGILKWITRLVLHLLTDCSVSSKLDRSYDLENLNEFLNEFHIHFTDDHSTLSDDDEGIISDDPDEEDLSRRVIHRALLKCINYTITNLSDTQNLTFNITEIQNFENNPIALYNQQILQILCSDTLELEIEFTQNSYQESFEVRPQISTNHYSVWANLWRDVTAEYLQFNNEKGLRKIDHYKNDHHHWSITENEIRKLQDNLKKPIANKQIKSNKNDDNNSCLHDRLMFEIKQQRKLKPSMRTFSKDHNRKRIQPVQKFENNHSSSDDNDDEQLRDKYGRKRVIVIDCLLESSPEDTIENKLITHRVSGSIPSINILMNNKTSIKTINYSTIENLVLEHISMEKLIQLMKDSSDTLSLTYHEFCHIRNVITRSELETLLFDEKLYNEVAQSKLCFTCRKVYFNILKFTFGVQCNVCKQKVCRNCVTQIALPKERLNDLPIQAITPLTLTKSDRCHSLETQSPTTPTMNDILNDLNYDDDSSSRRCSTPGNSNNQSQSSLWRAEPVDICTDCFFLLQQIRKKSRQRHISPAITSSLVSSTSFNRAHHSTSFYNLSSSASASSIAALLVQQQQRSKMIKTNSIHSNLKQTISVHELLANNDPLKTTIGTPSSGGIERVSLPRRHLFLKLQPAYDVKLNNIKTE